MGTPESLRDMFTVDHRHLIQGFSHILEALRNDDVVGAIGIAEEIDRQAGPHIEFEETILYPEVLASRGVEYAAALYEEHRSALQGIRGLLQAKELGLPQAAKGRIADAIQTGLDHAVSCGTLVSHLTSLDEAKQRDLRSRLLAIKERGRRWTELHPSGGE